MEPGEMTAGRLDHPPSVLRLDLDFGENQESVNIARIPASSMTTNSTPSASGPRRSNHSASATEFGPGRGRAGSGARTYGLTR
jgi:hypothetical protein